MGLTKGRATRSPMYETRPSERSTLVESRSMLESVVAKERSGGTFFNHSSRRIEESESSNGVELDLPAKHLTGIRFWAATHGGPVQSFQSGPLNLKFGVHLDCPLNRRANSIQPL